MVFLKNSTLKLFNILYKIYVFKSVGLLHGHQLGRKYRAFTPFWAKNIMNL